ncbi:hypothetical protein [uncultured Enterovirga sp.]|uniref:hypothetical protein n=1 Tax=uncultured Enterovirga sp. TaxID=2026352 RepID=UPI0035CA2F72
MVVFGLQGFLTDWCCDLTAALIGSQGRPPEIAKLNSIEDFAVQLLANPADLIVRSTWPDPILLNAVRRAGTACVFAHDQPLRSAYFRMPRFGEGYLNAIRGVMAESVALRGVTMPDVVHVRREEVVADPVAEIARIARALGLRDLGEKAGMLHQHCKPAFSYLEQSPAEMIGQSEEGAPKPVVSSQERAVLEAALGRLGTFGEEDQTRLLLTKDFFNFEGAPIGDGRIDATGRARLLVQGPHIFLAAGAWKARSVHRFSSDLAGSPFTIDAVSWVGTTPHDLARTTFTVPSSGGVVETLLNFAVTNPQGMIEMRLFADRAVFGGEISLGYVDVTRNHLRDPILDTVA